MCSEEDPRHPDAVQAAAENGCGLVLHPAGLHRDGQLHTSTESTTTQEVRPSRPASHPPPPNPPADGQTQTDACTDEKTDRQMDGQESDTRTQRQTGRDIKREGLRPVAGDKDRYLDGEMMTKMKR